MKALPTELGRMMRAWRLGQDGGWTTARAADYIGVSKSTWSDLENGKRAISLETAKALSRATGATLDEISQMSGSPIRHSSNHQERLQRADVAAQAIPGLSLLLGHFPDFHPDEVDLLLSMAESLIRRHTEPG